MRNKEYTHPSTKILQEENKIEYKTCKERGQYRVAQKKVYAFDFVQRKNYKCYVPQINVILSRKA
jgi:hypothetical protein